MIIDRKLFAVIPLAALLAIGCDNKGDAAKPTGSTSSATQAKTAPKPSASTTTATPPTAASSATAAKKHHARGPIGMVFRAADHTGAIPADKQAALAKIEEPFLAHDPATRAEYKTFHADLVAEVKEGKLDSKKLSADEAALEKDLEATQTKQAEALNAVHAALDPAQRKALTASIREDWEKHAKGDHEHGDHAHPAASGSAAPAASGSAAPDWSKKHLENLTKELDLDAAQQKAVGDLLAKSNDHAGWEAQRAAMKKHMETMLTAFEGDTFDAKKIMADDKMPKPHEAMDKHIEFLGKLLAILKPAQREKLAANMEKGHWTIGANGERHMGMGDRHDDEKDKDKDDKDAKPH